MISARVWAGLLAATCHTAVAAQPVPAVPAQTPVPDGLDEEEEPQDDGSEDIVITGQRPRGSVLGDIEPEITLDRREIRALGASNLAELIGALSPQTRSNRGRGDGGGPVILLNGRRISGFGELRDLPPEAIDRVEILPEEVALKYGYRADQRVVNIVLRQRFRATTAELEAGVPTAGGRSSSEADINILRIDRAGRWSLDAEYSRDTALFESERDIVQRDVDGTDDGAFRTLLPQVDRLTLGGTLSRTVFTDVSATLNGRFDANETVSRFGLPTGAGNLASALTRDGRNRNGHLGLSLNGDLQPWRWSLTANLDRNANSSLTDTDSLADPRARDRARSVDQSADAELVANGPLIELPAGKVTTSLKAGAAMRDFSSDSDRSGVFQSADLSRDRVELQGNIDVPLTSRRTDFLSAIGNLSANFNYAVDRLSDFGSLTTLGYGLNWEPIGEVRILASVTDEDGAPSVQQLGDPFIAQPNARVFDFTRGETVDVLRLTGGNPGLVADNRRVMKLGLTIQPLKETELTVSADYTDSRTRNVIAGFPTATPEIEAAFPDRFTRGADGRLTRIDSRPVNFARSDREELRYGLNFSKPLGKPDPARQDIREQRRAGRAAGTRPEGARGGGPGGPRGGGGGFGRGGGGFGRGGGFGGRGPGTLQLGLYHTWRFEDSILIRDGVPELDLLGGSAVGNRGGRARHEVELQSGVFKNGFGGRFTGNWQSGTTVRGGGANGLSGGDGDLRFGSFSTFNLRLFADLGAQEKLVARYPVLRGARVSLIIDNLFDARLRVRDEAGLTPLGYQGDLLDPLGRSFRISLRKVFFPSRRR